MLPVGGDGDERDELARDLIDDDVAWIFAAGLVCDDGGGRDADECGEDCGDSCADGQCSGRWMQDAI